MGINDIRLQLAKQGAAHVATLAPPPRASGAPHVPLRRAQVANSNGKCSVCVGEISAGESVVYDADDRSASGRRETHLRCVGERTERQELEHDNALHDYMLHMDDLRRSYGNIETRRRGPPIWD